MDTRSPVPPCWRVCRTTSCATCLSATATSLTSSKAISRKSCINLWPARSTPSWTRSAISNRMCARMTRARTDFASYAVAVPKPGATTAEATRVTGRFLRDIMKLNLASRNFRIMGPDETSSNRLDAVFEVTDRVSTAQILPTDDHVSPNGRVMEVLSEHMCQGWLDGYLLTGRHGFFSCYEAFIHIREAEFNQHATL